MKFLCDAIVSLRLICHVLCWRYFYHRTLKRVRSASKCRPIRVLFLVSESSKWKVQSLYDLMLNDSRFEPKVALTFADCDFELSEDERSEKRGRDKAFFKKRGILVVETLGPDLRNVSHISDYHPDVVFYQHPWNYVAEEMPGRMCKIALTCYLPYFVPNYGLIWNDCQQLFHRQLWRYFCLNVTWATLYRESKPWYKTAPSFVAVGHTMLDEFQRGESPDENGTYVIYAPHWSFSYPGHDNFENFSTFPKNGKLILEYAQKHPEVGWAFKPHPTLKVMLRRSGIMSEREIDDYYAAWESLGAYCYDGDYVELFRHSKAMITDCASFLVEYPCTGKPLIHLCSSNRKIRTMEPSRKLFSTFYKAHNEEEMYDLFEEIIIRAKDPKKVERLVAIRESRLLGNNAGQNIIDDLTHEFGMGNE